MRWITSAVRCFDALGAVLDVITIAVLATGLYLWLRRRKSRVSIERMIAVSSHDPQPAGPS